MPLDARIQQLVGEQANKKNVGPNNKKKQRINAIEENPSLYRHGLRLGR